MRSRLASSCESPSVSTISLRLLHEKSAMYGPIGSWRRNRTPRELRRSSPQRTRSAIVGSWRLDRANPVIHFGCSGIRDRFPNFCPPFKGDGIARYERCRGMLKVQLPSDAQHPPSSLRSLVLPLREDGRAGQHRPALLRSLSSLSRRTGVVANALPAHASSLAGRTGLWSRCGNRRTYRRGTGW